MPTDTDLAWAAGMIDGDGSISVGKGAGEWRRPILVVDNTDREIIDELVRLFGGSVVAKKVRKAHHRQAWSWRMYGATKIIALLTLVRPYMRCAMKRERARMLVEEWPVLTKRNGYYTEADRLAKYEWEDRFMALGNGRGKRAVPAVS